MVAECECVVALRVKREWCSEDGSVSMSSFVAICEEGVDGVIKEEL